MSFSHSEGTVLAPPLTRSEILYKSLTSSELLSVFSHLK